jgi:hypothetical protein
MGIGTGFDALDDALDDAGECSDGADCALPPLPPGGMAPNAVEHARRMLERAVRGRAVNEQRLSRAARRDQWDIASRHAARSIAAERAIVRWRAAIERLRNAQGPYRFDAFADFDAGDDEAFVRILRVLSGPRSSDGRPQLRAGRRIAGSPLLRQLWNTSQGIFLGGASAAQARQWAQRQAQRVGGVVVHDAPHIPGGRPHFHVERPDGERSGHIFYGGVPRGTFFEAPY